MRPLGNGAVMRAETRAIHRRSMVRSARLTASRDRSSTSTTRRFGHLNSVTIRWMTTWRAALHQTTDAAAP